MSDHPEHERVSLANVAYLHDISAGDLEKTVEIESGWDPAAVNIHSGSAGLIQWTRETAKSLGTSCAEIPLMDFEEQCGLIDRYLQRVPHPIGDDVYMAVACPAGIGAENDRVCYPVDPSEKSPWSQNPAWRSTGNGPITAGSIRAYFKNRSGPAHQTPTKRPGGPKNAPGAGLGFVLLLALCLFGLRSRRD